MRSRARHSYDEIRGGYEGRSFYGRTREHLVKLDRFLWTTLECWHDRKCTSRSIKTWCWCVGNIVNVTSAIGEWIWLSANCSIMGYLELCDRQQRAVASFVLGKDVLVCIPTSGGKSLCYSILPWVFNHGQYNTRRWIGNNSYIPIRRALSDLKPKGFNSLKPNWEVYNFFK